ncbi:hypothetical protein JTE90_012939, partial [Oedothorax gibbosus]
MNQFRCELGIIGNKVDSYRFACVNSGLTVLQPPQCEEIEDHELAAIQGCSIFIAGVNHSYNSIHGCESRDSVNDKKYKMLEEDSLVSTAGLTVLQPPQCEEIEDHELAAIQGCSIFIAGVNHSYNSIHG